MEKPILPVIAGPTASGKTACAVALCRLLDGEVVSADSMQIYAGMDILSAKPTLAEMGGDEVDVLPGDGIVLEHAAEDFHGGFEFLGEDR